MIKQLVQLPSLYRYGVLSLSTYLVLIVGFFSPPTEGNQLKDLLYGPNVCPIHPLCKFLALSNTLGRKFYQCRPSDTQTLKRPQCVECKLADCYSDIPVFTQKNLCNKLSACSIRTEKPTSKEVKQYSRAYAILWQCSDNLDAIDRCEPCDTNSCDDKKTWWESKSECETFDACQYGGESFNFAISEREEFFRPAAPNRPIQILPAVGSFETNRVESENLIQVGSGEEPEEIGGKRLETGSSQSSEGFIPVIEKPKKPLRKVGKAAAKKGGKGKTSDPASLATATEDLASMLSMLSSKSQDPAEAAQLEIWAREIMSSNFGNLSFEQAVRTPVIVLHKNGDFDIQNRKAEKTHKPIDLASKLGFNGDGNDSVIVDHDPEEDFGIDFAQFAGDTIHLYPPTNVKDTGNIDNEDSGLPERANLRIVASRPMVNLRALFNIALSRKNLTEFGRPRLLQKTLSRPVNQSLVSEFQTRLITGNNKLAEGKKANENSVEETLETSTSSLVTRIIKRSTPPDTGQPKPKTTGGYGDQLRGKSEIKATATPVTTISSRSKMGNNDGSKKTPENRQSKEQSKNSGDKDLIKPDVAIEKSSETDSTFFVSSTSIFSDEKPKLSASDALHRLLLTEKHKSANDPHAAEKTPIVSERSPKPKVTTAGIAKSTQVTSTVNLTSSSKIWNKATLPPKTAKNFTTPTSNITIEEKLEADRAAVRKTTLNTKVSTVKPKVASKVAAGKPKSKPAAVKPTPAKGNKARPAKGKIPAPKPAAGGGVKPAGEMGVKPTKRPVKPQSRVKPTTKASGKAAKPTPKPAEKGKATKPPPKSVKPTPKPTTKKPPPKATKPPPKATKAPPKATKSPPKATKPTPRPKVPSKPVPAGKPPVKPVTTKASTKGTPAKTTVKPDGKGKGVTNKMVDEMAKAIAAGSKGVAGKGKEKSPAGKTKTAVTKATPSKLTPPPKGKGPAPKPKGTPAPKKPPPKGKAKATKAPAKPAPAKPAGKAKSASSGDPCKARPLRDSCDDGANPQMVIRWYAWKGMCAPYNYAYCPGTSVIEKTEPIRTKEECSSFCLKKA